MTSNDEYVLTLLQEQGFLTAEQVAAAANSMREGSETTLDVLVSSGAISQDDVLGIIAEQFGIKYCHVDPGAINPEITKILPAEIARLQAGDQILFHLKLLLSKR